jgi:hypothetical protein
MSNENVFRLLLVAIGIATVILGLEIMKTRHTLERGLMDLEHKIERLCH